MDYNLLEESMINFVKQISISETRSDINYTFNQIKIPVNTKHNNGKIKSYHGDLPNKCFFISVADGINKYSEEINKIKNIEEDDNLIQPYQLVKLANFKDLYDLVDTDNPDHVENIQTLVKELDICLLVYIGNLQNNQWYTTPDTSSIFGDPKGFIQIRILNMGAHFEFITTPDINFIRSSRSMNDKRMQILQKDAWSNYF